MDPVDHGAYIQEMCEFHSKVWWLSGFSLLQTPSTFFFFLFFFQYRGLLLHFLTNALHSTKISWVHAMCQTVMEALGMWHEQQRHSLWNVAYSLMPYLVLSFTPQSCGLSLDYLEILLSPVGYLWIIHSGLSLFRQISLDLILVFINIPLRYFFSPFKKLFSLWNIKHR